MYRASGRAGPTDMRTDKKQYDDDVDCDDDHDYEGDSDDTMQFCHTRGSGHNNLGCIN